MSRVVITGLGAVTALGTSVAETWAGLLAGRSGEGPVQGIDVTDLPYQMACEVRQALPGAPAPSGPRKGRATAFLRQAVLEALLHSKLPLDHGERIGLAVGTTMGEIGGVEEGIANGEPLQIDPGGIARSIESQFALNGPSWTLTNACAAGNYAIAKAYDDLRFGRADAMIAGGVDIISWVAFTGFGSLRAMAREQCRPFDRNREGIMLGEGAAALLLEPLERALARRAPILAEVVGYGFSCDARHPTQPDPSGMALAMQRALASAGLVPDQIDYVSAHGTGTPNNDRAESQAMQAVFGERSAHLPISSIKAQLGHTLGAASAIEAVICTQALQTGLLPATMHLQELDPACPLDVIPNEPRKAEVRYLLSNAYAFGGNNSSLVLAAWDGTEGGQP